MLLVLAEATCSEILDIADSDEQENIESSYEKICQLVKKSIETAKDIMLFAEEDIQQIIYGETKRILKPTYGKNAYFHKALIKDIEVLRVITNLHKTASIYDFCNKLATMKKLDSVQSTVYTLMDKYGPVRELLTQTHDDWEE